MARRISVFLSLPWFSGWAQPATGCIDEAYVFTYFRLGSYPLEADN